MEISAQVLEIAENAYTIWVAQNKPPSFKGCITKAIDSKIADVAHRGTIRDAVAVAFSGICERHMKERLGRMDGSFLHRLAAPPITEPPERVRGWIPPVQPSTTLSPEVIARADERAKRGWYENR